MNSNHDEHGWFKPSPRSYEELLKDEKVQQFADSYSTSNKSGYLYAFQHYLNINNLTPSEVLELTDEKLKATVIKACQDKIKDGKYASAKKSFYAVKRFVELNGKDLLLTNGMKELVFKWKPDKVLIQHIPSKSEIYRAVDSVVKKDEVQKLRAKAILLCLYQSGVRGSCLCSFRFGLLKNKLYPNINEVPAEIKVVSHRPKGVYDVAVDTKLGSYRLPHYFTYLGIEALTALKDYLEARVKYDNWVPKDSDYIFVTSGTVSRGKPLNVKHLNEVVKTAFSQLDISKSKIWTHLMRKAFRMTLYKGGVDKDTAEVLMGHKLPGSKASYFDSGDTTYLRDEYSKADFGRFPVKELEAKISELQESKQEDLEKIQNLEKKLEYFQSNDFVEKIATRVKLEKNPFDEIGKHSNDVIETKLPRSKDTMLGSLLNEGYNLVSQDEEYFYLEKDI
ncbi:MAG: tyrosine-type recombinase/integrase [Tenericutes bacterium]|nr:tyrosine-type recombinase/integrase [Mycoplasmatota bacterium]